MWNRNGEEAERIEAAMRREQRNGSPPKICRPRRTAHTRLHSSFVTTTETPQRQAFMPAVLASIFLAARVVAFLRLPCIHEESRDLFHIINIRLRCKSRSGLRGQSISGSAQKLNASSVELATTC
jgi:hypothetical protein